MGIRWFSFARVMFWLIYLKLEGLVELADRFRHNDKTIINNTNKSLKNTIVFWEGKISPEISILTKSFLLYARSYIPGTTIVVPETYTFMPYLCFSFSEPRVIADNFLFGSAMMQRAIFSLMTVFCRRSLACLLPRLTCKIYYFIYTCFITCSVFLVDFPPILVPLFYLPSGLGGGGVRRKDLHLPVPALWLA